MTLFTGEVKKYPKRSELRELFAKSDEMGDPRITGIAVMLAMIEVTITVVLFFMTPHYQFAAFASIQSFIALLLFFDVFVGLLASCYHSSLQLFVFSVIAIAECFVGDDILLIDMFLPIPDDPEYILHYLMCMAVISWTAFRLTVTRHAMQSMYLSRTHARRIADLEENMK